MIRELKPSHKYLTVIAAISFLSFISLSLYSVVGELALPFSSAFLAVLFIFEKPDKRVLSFLVPVAGIAINLLVNGVYMIISVEAVILALIIAVCYRYSETKNTCALYLTATISVFLLISFYLSGARACGNFSPKAVAEYYSGVYTEVKDYFAQIIASMKRTGSDGLAEPIMTDQAAKELIQHYSKLSVAYIVGCSFLLTGISLKLFNYTVLKLSRYGIRKTFACFFPQSWVAYLYAVLSIISVFLELDGVIAISIANASQILMFVFAYLGIRYLMTIVSASGRKGFFIAIILFGLIFMTSVTVQVISYFGAWIVVSTNLIKPKA